MNNLICKQLIDGEDEKYAIGLFCCRRFFFGLCGLCSLSLSDIWNKLKTNYLFECSMRKKKHKILKGTVPSMESSDSCPHVLDCLTFKIQDFIVFVEAK